MAFHLKHDEPVGKAIKRVVGEQIDDALANLQRRNLPDEAVHEVRKHFKRIRAVLRLVRGELGEEVYRRENTCFRDVGRPLTEVRDAQVLLETLDQLRAVHNGRIAAASFERIRTALERRRRDVRKRVLGEQKAVCTIEAAVNEVRRRLEEWPIAHDGWGAVGDGIEAVYKKGCRAFAAAGANPSPDFWHEWRKQAKYLWHEIQVLEPLWSEVLEKLGDEVHRLTQILGDEHDLVVLRQTLVAEPDAFGRGKTLQGFLARIDHRREELRREARPLGERIYVDPPSAFAGRLHGYWKVWRREGDAGS